MEPMSYGTPGPGGRYGPHMSVGPADVHHRHRAEQWQPAPGSANWEQPEPPRGGFGRSERRWPLIADDFFFVAHDDYGQPRLHRDLTRLGLGAAVLAELLITRYADISGPALVPTVAAHPGDPVAATVMVRLLDEAEAVPVRDWLAYLANAGQPDGDLYDQVGQRMVSAGKLRAERSGLLRRSTRYVPADINAAAWPWARLSQQLERGTQLDDADTMLGGLLLATGLHSHVLNGDTRPLESRLRHNISAAPTAVRELLRHTETAVGSAVGTVA